MFVEEVIMPAIGVIRDRHSLQQTSKISFCVNARTVQQNAKDDDHKSEEQTNAKPKVAPMVPRVVDDEAKDLKRTKFAPRSRDHVCFLVGRSRNEASQTKY
ncbi:hypothetical protein F442_03454 [Phytophthora nicotianae P10297]|uniref:Uncharacterized protein n=1 Tax=Phytophthora nicotianae P10297 TaxID=1317064 RepID=W2ZWJ2_PHYNI|nr:hypothetical protein F442_03454 [Phytophthora nicotianae P10297]